MSSRQIASWLFFCCLFTFSTSYAQETVQIGVVGPLQGESKYGGNSHREGLLLAVEEFNSNPTNRYTIQLIFRDDKGLPDESRKMTEDLINNSMVLAVMGSCNSACTLADAELAQEHEVVLFTSVSAATEITRTNNPYVFRAAITSLHQMRYTAEFLIKERKIERLAFLYEDKDDKNNPDAYGRGLRDDFLVAVEALGVRREDVMAIGYTRNQPDFRRELEQITQGNYQALGLFGLLNDSVNIAKTALDMGMGVTLFGGTGIAVREYVENGRKFVEGSIVFSPFFALDSDWNVYQFTEKYYKRFGNYPDTYAAQSYDAMKMLIQALGKVELSDLERRTVDIRRKVRDELEQVKYDGVSGYLKFDEHHDTDRRLKILVAHNGRLVPIRTVEDPGSFFTTLGYMGLIIGLIGVTFLIGILVIKRVDRKVYNVLSLFFLIGVMSLIYWKIPHFPEQVAVLFVVAFLALLGIMNVRWKGKELSIHSVSTEEGNSGNSNS
jgi:branched-chain amino acid transport system substrate-binding protein